METKTTIIDAMNAHFDANQKKKLMNNNPLSSDSLFEQLANISKASAYDILSKQVGELKAENERMKEQIASLVNIGSLILGSMALERVERFDLKEKLQEEIQKVTKP